MTPRDQGIAHGRRVQHGEPDDCSDRAIDVSTDAEYRDGFRAGCWQVLAERARAERLARKAARVPTVFRCSACGREYANTIFAGECCPLTKSKLRDGKPRKLRGKISPGRGRGSATPKR